jgi:ribonuclease HI
MAIKKAVIHSDGASRNNPGQAAIGATIKDEQGRILATISRRIGITTNNQAEYRAVISALKKAIQLGARQVELNLDSELVARQITGRYRVKNIALKPLFEELKKLLGSLESYTINCIPRHLNQEADRLANCALL